METRLEKTLRALVAGRTEAKPRVAVAMANNPEVIGSVSRVLDEELAHVVLVGPRDEIVRIADDLQVNLSTAEFEETTDPLQAATIASSLAKSGDAQVLMKGLIQTADFVRSILDKRYGLLAYGALLGHVAVADVPSHHKLILLTDAAINVAPDSHDSVVLIDNAVALARKLGIVEPRVACVAPAEKPSDKVPSTVKAREIVELFAQRKAVGDGEAAPSEPAMPIVDGPFGLDVALSAQAARIKGIASPVAGEADVILAPGIDSGNILYKAISILASGRLAAFVAGARVPIVLTSRADTEETKYLSLLLALVSAT